jgi:hypothetical protein
MSGNAAPQSGAERPTQYRVVCAWCPTVLVEGDPGAPVSHGMCDPCLERMTDHQNETEALVDAAEARIR